MPRTITDAHVEEVVVRTLEEVPEGATHRSKRELAKRVGISPTSVHRIWRAFGLQPWRTEDFKISPDPLLIDKIRDVIGLYLAPPANAAVFAVDEKPPGSRFLLALITTRYARCRHASGPPHGRYRTADISTARRLFTASSRARA